MSIAVGYVTFDCADTRRLAAFWSAALGYQNKGGDEDWTSIAPADGSGVPMLFQRVPEGKAGKNRVHFDLNASDFSTELQRLLDLGARRAQGYEEAGNMVVLLDP